MMRGGIMNQMLQVVGNFKGFATFITDLVRLDRMLTVLQIAQLMLMYPVVYMIVWTLPTAIRIYQTITHTPSPFALQTLDKVSRIQTASFPADTNAMIQVCIVSQGLVDAVIYGINEVSLSQWRELIFSESHSDVATGTSLPAGISRHHDRGITNHSGVDIVSSASSETRIIASSKDMDTSSVDKEAGIELTVMPLSVNRRTGLGNGNGYEESVV
jgi:hypothetical protein